MLRKFIVAASLAGALLVPAVADASVKGAERAVKRELMWDYNIGSKQGLFVDCVKSGRGYYCEFDFIGEPGTASNGYRYDIAEGRARVTSRYRVDYRIYW